MKTEKHMKKKEFLIDKSLLFMTLLIVVGQLFTSCTKNESNNDAELGNSTINVVTEGIKLADEDIKIKASLNSRSNKQTLKNISTIKDQNLMIDVISEQNNINNEHVDNINLEDYNNVSADFNKANITNSAERVSMENGVKYCFLLFDKQSRILRYKVLATAGQPLSIDIDKGSTLTWVAYSYNTTQDFDLPNTDNPVIMTPVDKPLLYASGDLTTVAGNNNITIIFSNKLTQLNVRLDSRAMFFDISQISAKFEGNPITTSNFDLLTGQKIGEALPVEIDNIIFQNISTESNRMKEAKGYYTSNNNLSYFEVKFTSITGTYPNGVSEVLTSRLPNNGLVRFDLFKTPNPGNILVGRLKFWLVLPSKSVVSYGALNGYGYAAEANYASGNLLRNEYNFGPTSNYSRIQPMSFSQISASAGALANRLSNPASYPDVMIIGIFGGYANAADYNALKLYLEKGGVVFLMTENTDTQLLTFMRSVLNNQSITLRNADTGGSVYELANVDPDVLNGVFGDVRGKLWGQDGSASLYINGYTGNEIVTYSGSSVTYPVSSATAGGITMFRHKSLNLFYCGDTGFLANNMANGTYLPSVYYNIGPFGTIGGSDPDRSFPNTRMYGHYALANSVYYADPSKRNVFFPITNSFLFANVFTWMLERSHFAGIDRN